MCGIAGVSGTANASDAAVQGMLAGMAHRGPDEEGISGSAGTVIGCRRLAVIDVADGHQPMRDETGDILAIQNGELYNYQELRADLVRRGHRLVTRSDTEILPHLYEEHGPDFPRLLRGMFAIVVWDARTRTLVLTRDRLGKKPLLYSESGGVAFASELAPLLDLGISREIDDAAIREYLAFGYVRAPRTAFSAIRSVRPGHVRLYRDGALVGERPYWRLAFSPKERIGEADALERLRSAIAEAVRIRLISDVPLGAFLSGGIDSSTVVAFMAQESDTTVRTYSVGFADEDYSELKYARLVAERFGTDHHEFVVEPEAAAVLPMLVRHVGQPFADASIVPTYYVAKTARQHVTVALNGDGGDELFAGYTRYRAALLAGRVDRVPRPLRALAAAGARRLPEPAWLPGSRRARRFTMTLGMPPEERYRRWTGFFADDARILGERLRDLPEPTAWLDEARSEAGATDGLDEMLAIDMRAYLPGDLLVKMDIATMAASLEGRSPFLDHKVVELMAHLPSSLKLRGGTSKVLLRKLMRGTLPEEVLDRSKMGFGAPIGRWLRGPLRELVEDAVVNAPDRGYVDRARARQIVSELYASPTDNGLRVWCLLMLELWFRYVVEAAETRAYTSA